MKIVALAVALAVGTTGVAVAQSAGSRGTSSTNRPNSSNFGWQDRQREADEARDKLLGQLAALSEQEWKDSALAMMTFDSSDRGFSFEDVVRIKAASADRKATTREGQGSTSEAPSWTVDFAKKTPKILTLTLSDPKSTEVRCEIGPLLEAGAGYLGIFFTEAELICVTRPEGSS